MDTQRSLCSGGIEGQLIRKARRTASSTSLPAKPELHYFLLPKLALVFLARDEKHQG